jgi:hypothetical protein
VGLAVGFAVAVGFLVGFAVTAGFLVTLGQVEPVVTVTVGLLAFALGETVPALTFGQVETLPELSFGHAAPLTQFLPEGQTPSAQSDLSTQVVSVQVAAATLGQVDVVLPETFKVSAMAGEDARSSTRTNKPSRAIGFINVTLPFETDWKLASTGL